MASVELLPGDDLERGFLRRRRLRRRPEDVAKLQNAVKRPERLRRIQTDRILPVRIQNFPSEAGGECEKPEEARVETEHLLRGQFLPQRPDALHEFLPAPVAARYRNFVRFEHFAVVYYDAR